MKLRILPLILLSWALIASCEDDHDDDDNEGPAKLTIAPVLQNAGTQVFLGSLIPVNDSTEALIESVRFYYSHLRLLDEDGDTVDLAGYGFFDLAETNIPGFPDRRTVTYKIPDEEYTALIFNLGLDSAQNYSDPSLFPSDDPLSAATGMYWTWGTQYRFIMMEGRANAPGTVGTGGDQAFSYHPGGNHLYVEDIVVPVDIDADDGEKITLELFMNTDAWFNGSGGAINPYAEFAAHDSPQDQPLALKFTTNFADGF